MTVNWHNIRIHNGSQDQGFEELCCQLFHNEKPPDAGMFERRGYRDAGLECVHVSKDGSLRGMQAKFFTRSPSADEWGQVDKSVRTALAKNPKLKSLTICIPQNFDDPKIAGQSNAMDKWKTHKAGWEKLAQEMGVQVEFVLWDDTQLTSRITQVTNRGRRWYFFSQAELTPAWFRQRVEEVAKDARPRYTEELNVHLPIASLFEGLGRTTDFSREPRKQRRKLASDLATLSSRTCPVSAEAITAAVTRTGQELMDLVSGLDFRGIGPLPLCRLSDISGILREAAHEARRVLDELQSQKAAQERAEREAEGKAAPSYQEPVYNSLRGIHWQIASAAHYFSGFAESDEATLANRPVLLVTGSAGKGKTHLLVDVAKGRAAQGQPTLVLLGENFRDRDPLTQIMELVGINLDRDDFLQALAAAAEASGGRLLIMIDALNEGQGLDLWPRRLSGFVEMLSRYPRIGLVMSVRTTYEETVIPESVKQEAVRVTHYGFASQPEEAARAFFSHYGLSLPKIPLLNPEFTDPLFLKLLCQGLQSEGLRDVPEGYEGISRMFGFLVDASNKKLRQAGKLRTNPHQNVVRRYLNRLADALSSAGSDALPFDVAEQIGYELYPSDGYPDSLLACLISEGLLATEMIASKDASPPQHGVGFAYQRFRDHEVARRLLERCQDNADMETAFNSGGAIGRLFADPYNFYRCRGLVEALSVQVPERGGKELIDLLQPSPESLPNEIAKRVLPECLVESLPWRSKDSITDGTFAALQRECTSQSLYDRYLDGLLTLAAVPDHPLNAELLHSILLPLPLPDRDEFWTVWLYYHRGTDNAADRLLAWCLLGDDKTHLSDDSVLLAGIAVAWLTVSTVRPIRDRATKALTRLLTPRPHLVASLLDRFDGVDDPYVSERLYAATYGVAMRLAEPEQLRQLAVDVYGRLFAQRPAKPHVMVRDHGRGIVEHAAARGCSLPFNIVDVRPPYGSTLPPDPPSREHFESLISKKPNWTDRDRALSHMVNRFGDFDVSRLAGGPAMQKTTFSLVTITEEVSSSHRVIREAWEQGLTEEQYELWEQIESRRSWAAPVEFVTTDTTDEEAEDLIALTDTPEEEDETLVTDEYSLLCTSFINALSEAQLETFGNVVLDRTRHPEDDLPSLDGDLIVRWVIQRTLELGWTAERFAYFDAIIERGRDAGYPTALCDTIGAKYLWIAYHEVIARLTDNYRLLNGYRHDVAEPFQGSWELDLRTIDPSCLPLPRNPSDREGSPLRLPTYYDVNDVTEDHDDWLRRSDDLPDVAPLLILKDADEREWVVLESYPHYKQESDDGEWGKRHRNLWLHLRGYLLKRETAQETFDWMKGQNFMNRWMPEGAETNGIFLGELYNSPAWEHYAFDDEWQYSDWRKPEHECPAEVASVKLSFFQSSEDASTPEPMRIMLPAPLLVREANLRWSGEAGNWLDSSGSLAVQDPNAVSGEGGRLLMRRDFLDRFLADHGYDLVWTLLGEKLVYNLSSNHPHPRLEISGSVRYSAHGLEEAIQKKYVTT